MCICNYLLNVDFSGHYSHKTIPRTIPNPRLHCTCVCYIFLNFFFLNSQKQPTLQLFFLTLGCFCLLCVMWIQTSVMFLTYIYYTVTDQIERSVLTADAAQQLQLCRPLMAWLTERASTTDVTRYTAAALQFKHSDQKEEDTNR